MTLTQGEAVKAYRRSIKSSLEQLGKDAGVSSQTIAHIEKGRTVSRKTLELLSKEINVDLTSLPPGPSSSSPSPPPALEGKSQGQALFEWRKATGITRKDLAKEAGISEVSLRKVEQGEHLGWDTLQKAEKVTGIDFRTLPPGPASAPAPAPAPPPEPPLPPTTPPPPPLRRNSMSLTVKGYRKAKGLAQHQFADEAGVNRRFVSMVESGRGNKVPQSVLRKLSDAVGLDLLKFEEIAEIEPFDTQTELRTEMARMEWERAKGGLYFILRCVSGPVDAERMLDLVEDFVEKIDGMLY